MIAPAQADPGGQGVAGLQDRFILVELPVVTRKHHPAIHPVRAAAASGSMHAGAEYDTSAMFDGFTARQVQGRDELVDFRCHAVYLECVFKLADATH